MISLDSNLLLYAVNKASPWHERARAFLESLSPREDVALSELVLVEFYTLLRNPAVLTAPLDAPQAVAIIQNFRRHPRWSILGCPPAHRQLYDELWPLAATAGFARRRIYDARLALTLRLQGVKEFATANVRDFSAFGFARVWNPLEE